MTVKVERSKYGIEYEIKWNDGLGRFVAHFNSTGGASASYVVRDMDVTGIGTRYLEEDAEEILFLNFWLLCLQQSSSETARQGSSEAPKQASAEADAEKVQDA